MISFNTLRIWVSEDRTELPYTQGILVSFLTHYSVAKKSIFLTLITTFGVQKNDYAFELIQNEVVLEDLFE